MMVSGRARLVELGLEGVEAALQRGAHGADVEHLVQVLIVRRLQLLPQPAGARARRSGFTLSEGLMLVWANP